MVIPLLGDAQPAYATRRNPRIKSMGAGVDVVMRRLGHSPMPWQRYASAVANEVDPYQPRRWRYDVVLITVPRQCGKTTWMLDTLGHRLISFNNHHSIMTAQTGKDARKRWDSLVKTFDAKRRTSEFKVRESSGSESLVYLRRSSDLMPFAPTPKSVHGDTKNDVGIDEAWAFDSAGGYDLMAAVQPTQLTISDSQLIIVSTRGTSKSTWLNGLIEQGRASVGDPDSRMAYIEFSADPEAAARDPFSDETLAFHPAIGHTQTASKIRSLYTGDLAVWYRSYLNLESPISDDAVIDLAIWDSLADDHPGPMYGSDDAGVIPAPSGVHVSYDVAYDRTAATIVGAWFDGDGLHMQVLASREGVEWLPPTLANMARAGYASITADDVGPTRTVTEDLRAELPGAVQTLTVREYATACQLFTDRVKDGLITHDAHPTMRTSLQNAKLRPFGGAMAFDPQRSPGPIDALRAAAVAVYKATKANANGFQLFFT